MGDLNFNTLVATCAVIIALLALTAKMFDKAVSLREHFEFKESIKAQIDKLTMRQEERLVIREFKEWREQINRDFDRIEHDLRIIDETKPSAETLEEAMKSVDARVRSLEIMVGNLKNGKSS